MLKMYKPNKEVAPKEPEYSLTMREDPDRIAIYLCDDFGEALRGGYLLSITKETGAVRLFSGINKTYGLDLDGNRRLKLLSD